MDVIAQVFDVKITRSELDFEVKKLLNQFPDISVDNLHKQALNRLIDRYLLMHDAEENGICAEDCDFDNAMMEFLESIESPEESALTSLDGREMQIERIVRCNLMIRKYLESLSELNEDNIEEKLLLFYNDRKEIFNKDEEVRASHILIKGTDEESHAKAIRLWEEIKSPEDFTRLSSSCSDCPSGTNCGDLGFFPRGRILPELEEVAFRLQINEISEPFKTRYGYHILMLTDRQDKLVVPFEAIKDSLRMRLISIEQDVIISRLLKDIRTRYASMIQIF